MRNHHPTPWRLLSSLQAVLWAVLALCVGNAFGSLTLDPLDLPKADSADTARIREVAEAQSAQILALEEIGNSAEDCLGRELLTNDPMDQFYNPYSYGGGDPLSWADPWGLEASYDRTGTGYEYPGGISTAPSAVGDPVSPVTVSAEMVGVSSITTVKGVYTGNSSTYNAGADISGVVLRGILSPAINMNPTPAQIEHIKLWDAVGRGDEAAMMQAGVGVPGVGNASGDVILAMSPFLGWLKGGFRGVVRGEAGRFGDLAGRSVKGDLLTPHHMPQAALGFTTRADGGALMMTEAEHVLTRTYGFKGAITATEDAKLSFRSVLAKDIRDVRGIAGSQYNSGLQNLLGYYRLNYPKLMAK